MSNVEGGKPMVRRNTGVELVPRPSESPLDPLNWPQWKKELAFGSLVLGSAVIGVLKTILVTVNGVISTELNCSYMAATALTGLPLIIGAFSGLGSTILAQKVGKRGIYLASSLLLLGGAIWNMHVEQSYAQFMVSRLFQGIAWGAFESLVLTSFKDMFFVHQRPRHVVMYNISNIFFTWGTPILGGYLSQDAQGFRNQIMAINIIQAFSVVLLIFATPETTFSRSTSTSTSQSSITTMISAPSAGKFKSYLSTLRFPIPSTSSTSKSETARPLRALAAPTTLLTFLLTGPPTATALALASTLSLLFSSMPTFLFPARIGYLFIAPAILSLVLYTASSFLISPRTSRSKPATAHPFLIAIPALILSFAGAVAFGLYTYNQLMATTRAKGGEATLYVQGQDLSLQIVSVLFGLLVSGAVLVNAAGVSILSHTLTSTSSSSSSSTEETHHQAQDSASSALQSAHALHQDLLSGLFIIAMPLWVKSGADMLAGLKDAAIALAVLQVVLGSSVAALLWVQGR
ncbi:putative MFS-type transporter protein, partial [Lachnellula arida]